MGDWALLWRGRLHPSPMSSLGSSSRVTLAHTVLSSSSTTLLSYRLYYLMPDCMMCFTSDSSRSFVGHHQMLLHRCPPSTMVHQFDNQIGSCGPGWRARYARSSSSGRVVAASATWEDVEFFTAKYPDFQLKDELLLDRGRDVMYSRTYRRSCDGRRAAERSGSASTTHAPGPQGVV